MAAIVDKHKMIFVLNNGEKSQLWYTPTLEEILVNEISDED